MLRHFDVHLPLERNVYVREAMLAVELLDAVTLERVTRGMDVTAIGLIGKPIENFGGLFVWLKEDTTKFEKLVVETRSRPFERVEIPAAQVQLPLHTIELSPLASYPFSSGTTAIRGSLFETMPQPGVAPIAISGANIRLEWLNEDQTWIHAPTMVLTNTAGDFTSILRFASKDDPTIDAQGKMSIRLFAKRAANDENHQVFQLPQGRAVDMIFAWDELQQ